MPFCDTMCTGVAAIDLSGQVATSYAGLSTQISTNIGLITSLTASVEAQQASIYSAEYIASQRRITAYDGVAKVVSLSVERMEEEFTREVDYLLNESFLLQKSLRVTDLAMENGKRSAIKTINLANSRVSAMPALAEEVMDSKIRAKEAVFGQIARSKHIGDNNIEIQKKVLLSDIDFDLPNPFTVDEIDIENWEQYQDLLFLTFNSTPFSSESSLEERKIQVKRQIALSIISQIWSETALVSDEKKGALGLLVNNTSVTLKSALFEQYKQEILNTDVQTNIKSLPIGSLMLIQTLQLAQKNLLLREIADTKKLKNTLLALDAT